MSGCICIQPYAAMVDVPTLKESLTVKAVAALRQVVQQILVAKTLMAT